MGEKIVLSKHVAVALGKALSNHLNNKEEVLKTHADISINKNGKWIGGNFQYLNELSLEQMAIALYVGYEVEETPEEKLLNVWQSTWDEYNRITDFQNRPGGGYENGFAKGIEKAIDILGIQIKGINK